MTMKEVLITRKDDKVSQEIKDVEIPTPADNEVLIKIHVSGTNPKDWKYTSPDKGANGGDDMAGTIEKVGKDVKVFSKGQRVAAYHVIGAPNGSFAEYGIAPASTTFHIPDSLSYEEASTIPLAALTAGVGLHQRLRLPTPWTPATEKTPLVVYGGSTSVGLFVLKLAKLSNIHPVIAIAGGGADVIRKDNLADEIVDYRNNDDLAGSIRKALGGVDAYYAYDTISEKGTTAKVAGALAKGAQIAHLIPVKQEDVEEYGVKLRHTYVGSVHKAYEGVNTEEQSKIDRPYGELLSRWFTIALNDGSFTPHPHEVQQGGLNNVKDSLQLLYDGKVSAKKLVIRIADTK